MHFFAVDLGATSGRTILGTINDGRLTTRELTRFPNRIIHVGKHFYWDIFALYDEVIKGLTVCADERIHLTSIGIDSWGCDFVCVGDDGIVLRNPICYRDPYTEGAMERYFQLIPKEKVYELTGVQFMNFNSLFQLAEQKRTGDSALKNAMKVLFIPDALVYMLTGEFVCESTVLSTGQLLDPRRQAVATQLLEAVGLKQDILGKFTQAPAVVGNLTPDIRQQTGLTDGVNVVSVAGHDTASAVIAIPASDERFAYLSCGTWSLLGIEVSEPIINKQSLEYNFTNEGGIEGTTRFLKNICGMWLLERCRKEWTDAPESVNQINRDAMEAEEFKSFINPDDPRFANPDSMVRAIQDYCKETGQYVPHTYKEIARLIFESLALRYRQVMGYLQDIAPFPIERLHVIGGGTLNTYLMQMTADSIGMPVLTGPVEATAIGNIMVQTKAAGLVGDRTEMRKIVAGSVEMKTYIPHDKEKWDEAYKRFCRLCV